LNSCCSKSAALLAGVLAATGCTDRGQPDQAGISLCQSETTPIIHIQGEDFRSPLTGSTASVRGVVTLRAGDGFYLESAESASQEGSSALFVDAAELARSVEPGQQWALQGTVAELGSERDTLTALSAVTGSDLCASGRPLPLTPAALPLDARAREALEGMRLHFTQPLSISDVYLQYRGEVTVSAGAPLRVPTEVEQPGSAARQLASQNRAQSLAADLPETGQSALPVGTQLSDVVGVLGHDGRQGKLLLQSLAIRERQPAPELAPGQPGRLRVVSANLLNFFNGDGRGGGFPTERGAETPAAFAAQSARLRAAIEQMRPDLLAVQELENDGFGTYSAAAELQDLLDSSRTGKWSAVDPETGRIGEDVITVGLFYRRESLETVGRAAVLDGPAFRRLSRQPLAQLFRHRASGQTFMLVVNHLKSKGRCPDSGANADQDDGQGCWNAARVAAVEALSPWLRRQATAAGTDRILIMGDMNAWRLEDPIRRFRELGYADLVEQLSGLPQHSFLYWGALGTLDYAFASPALAAHAVAATNWHVNARWPQRMELQPPWLRYSDHDPVVVDFDFSQPATSD
jgi:predicted extracellular nuclease